MKLHAIAIENDITIYFKGIFKHHTTVSRVFNFKESSNTNK